MSPYNPQASTTATNPSQTPDTQSVIGLLGSLMPLLLQIQMQSREQMFQPGSLPGLLQPGLFHPGSGQPSPLNPDQSGVGNQFGNLAPNLAPTNLAPMNPMLDHQAAVELVGDITSDALRTLSNYLETYSGQHQELESCVPIVTQAARCFAVRDYAQTLGHIWQAYRTITALRAGNPQLPPPSAARTAGAAFSSTTTIVH